MSSLFLDCFPCFSRNEVDKQMRKDYQRRNRTVNILLLGAGECGKSTVFKQIERKYLSENFEKRRSECRKVALTNLIVATWQLLYARDAFEYSYDNIELENRFKDATDFLDPRSKSLPMPPTSKDEYKVISLYPDIAELIDAIWTSASIQQTLARKSEFYLLDSAEYFKSKLNVIKNPIYIPTDEDVLKARLQTTGAQEISFEAKLAKDRVFFHVTDIGGQKSERKHWHRVLAEILDVKAIIYVFSLGDYNLEVSDSSQPLNRMLENTKIFSSIINKAELKDVNIVVFLNKIDVFEEKLKHVPLTVCYPEYAEDDRDPRKAIEYIKEQIESQDTNGPRSMSMRGSSSRNSSLLDAREIIFHETHATDPNAFETVIESVLRNIQIDNLKRMGMA